MVPIVAQRLDAMLDDIEQARQALSRIDLSDRLADRVGHDFSNALESQSRKCARLRQGLGQGEDPDAWNELRRLRSSTTRLLTESLALIQASLARNARVAVEACELADALLDDLDSRLGVGWKRFTVLDAAEFVSGPADIIRIRFPETTIWSMPIVAHELGHFVGRELHEDDDDGDRSFPFTRMLRDEASERGAYLSRQLDETFADVFAAWTVGPAYAMACLCLRFDPTTETDPFEEHPGDVERMEAILRTIEHTSERVPAQRPITAELREAWNVGIDSAGADAVALTERERSRLSERLAQLWDLIEAFLPARALYDGWSRADALAESLARGEEPAIGAAELSPWDAINAGWACRFGVSDGDVYGTRRLAAETAKLCRQIIGGAGG